jgi:hypothetical protein
VNPITDGLPRFGKFLRDAHREVDGELRVAGRNTSLYLHDDSPFFAYSPPDGCITGVLRDFTRISLIGCQTSEWGDYSRRNRGRHERSFYAKLFPHFVLEGELHLGSTDAVIVECTLVLDDAPALFYDFDAFGTLIDSSPYIETIVAGNKLDRPVPIGPEPQIAYFTGKRIIVEADTAIGRVLVQHNPLFDLNTIGGPRGVRIDNVITINIMMPSAVIFDDMFSRVLRLLRFLQIVIGRPQSVEEFHVIVQDDEVRHRLQVHWSLGPSREQRPGDEKRSLQPADLLLDPVGRTEEFNRVMCSWLASDEERDDARQRLQACFSQQEYSVDRLVSAANVFDILPSSAVPPDVGLSDELSDAKERCREIFRQLPTSYERDSVLGALGRVGKAALKHKTRHRAKHLLKGIGRRRNMFPDLVFVLNQAVDCRNHYVHGSRPRFDYRRNPHLVSFFVDTLEFVFAAAELLECGWDLPAFLERGTTMSHRFGAYSVNYGLCLDALRNVTSSH